MGEVIKGPWKAKESPEERAERLARKLEQVEVAGMRYLARPQRVDDVKISPLGNKSPQELEEILLSAPENLDAEGVDVPYFIAALELLRERSREVA